MYFRLTHQSIPRSLWQKHTLSAFSWEVTSTQADKRGNVRDQKEDYVALSCMVLMHCRVVHIMAVVRLIQPLFEGARQNRREDNPFFSGAADS